MPSEPIAGLSKEVRAKRQARLAKTLRFKGRKHKPAKLDEHIIARVEDALSLGCTQSEACILANITPKTLIEFKKENPVWAEREKFLMDTQVRKAKGVISDALDNGDVNTAKWYLEKKCREEFGNQIKINNTVTIKQAVVNWQKTINAEFSEVQEVEDSSQEISLIEYSGEQEEDSGTSTD